MEQIYYTQCPMGYGLGASNGFQIKRRSEGYPVSSDFRHLGLRAYPGGGRVLAPATLRYKHDDTRYEIAFLSPRAFEYETEGGTSGSRLWGRPGGHFAHGILLDRTEFDAIDRWPAGLFDSAIWIRSDPVPTLTQPEGQQGPAQVTLSREALLDRRTAWQACSALLPRADLIAGLLTAIAQAALESRTLFLIDEPDRLAPLIELLTWVFPRSLRADLTFSTFHDRPEELPGYRIHGTIATARPNRQILLTQGFIADVKSGQIEPPIEPASWARLVAGWLQTGEFETLTRWAAIVEASASRYGATPWMGERLVRAAEFVELVGTAAPAVEWPRFRSLVDWIPEGALRNEWANAHPPEWWLSGSSFDESARASLVRQAGFAASWKGEKAAGWGKVVSRVFANAPGSERLQASLVFWKTAPNEGARIAFLRADREHSPLAIWTAIRKRLEAELPADSETLLALDTEEAVATACEGKFDSLDRLIDRSLATGKPPVNFLSAIAAEMRLHQGSTDRIATRLGRLLESPDAANWALRQDVPEAWLGPRLRRLFADADTRDEWNSLILATPSDHLPQLARTVLEIASESGMADEAFVWGVEDILLRLPESQRPSDNRWPGTYLDRMRSDLRLIARLRGNESPSPEIRRWFKAASERGELDRTHKKRIEHVGTLAKTLAAQAPAPLDELELARIPAVDRAEVLKRWLTQGRPNIEQLLESCGDAWAESFLAGAEEMPELAKAIAGAPFLRHHVDRPERWLQNVLAVCRRLQPQVDETTGLSEDNLVSHVVAATADPGIRTQATWRLLEYLVTQEFTKRTIGEAFRADLARRDPVASAEVVEAWDKATTKLPPANSYFWETVLNLCDSRRLKVVVGTHGVWLANQNLVLPWWDHDRVPGSVNDMRDAFARLIAFAPIEGAMLANTRTWMNGDAKAGTRPWLSLRGRARWDWIYRLSDEVFNDNITDKTRAWNVFNWRNLDPDDLTLDEKHALIAWVIYKIKDPSEFQIPPVAKWLVRLGLTEVNRVKDWKNELRGLDDVPINIVRDRSLFVERLRSEMNTLLKEQLT